MKNKYYPHLFEKGQIGNLTTRNRIVRNSMGTYLANPDCSVSDRNIKAAAEAAAGGAGVVFMDNSVIQDMYHMGLSAASDRYIPGLHLVAEAIKDRGAVAGAQLAHAGRDLGFVGGEYVVSASSITYEPWYEAGAELPTPLTIDEIHELVKLYGQAADRLKRAGFDIIEVHSACGCLPCNFLSPHDNKRNDMYGGTLHNRMRFIVEIIRSIKSFVGPDFPLSVKLSMDDYEPEGIRLEETVEVCKALDAEGVALLNLVTGTHATTSYHAGFYKWGYCADMAAQIKEQVKNAKVMVTGSIQMPEKAEEILATTNIDFIGLARQELADPYWPKKAKEGRRDDITPCIRCLIGCTDRGVTANMPIHCAVNPTLYRYSQEPYEITGDPKKVAIVGAGPAGLQAAVTAARCGHNVTLFEKREIGGAMIEAGKPWYKSDLKLYIDYFKVQLEKLGIPVVKEEVTADTVKKGGFDVAIVAVGGKARRLNVPGADAANVGYAMDYINGFFKADPGKKAVVIGGGITGAEVALELAYEGKEVTIVEMMDRFLDPKITVVPAYFRELEKYQVAVITGKRLESVQGNKAVIVDRYGNQTELEADTVVIAAGFLPDKQLAEAIEAETEAEVITAGDCNKARQIIDAVHEGYAAARYL